MSEAEKKKRKSLQCEQSNIWFQTPDDFEKAK